MMKVAIVNAPDLPVPPVLGGAVEQILFETAQTIHNPKITVISLWNDALSKASIVPSAPFKHVNIQTERDRITTAFRGRLPTALKQSNRQDQFYYLNGVTDLLHQINPDIIEAHHCPGLLSYFQNQFPNKILLLFLQNDYRILYHDPYPRNQIVKKIDHLVFISRFLQQRFIARYPHAANKTHIIPNGVDTTVFHPKLKSHKKIRQIYDLPLGKTLLFAGRTIPEKGIHILLKAMSLVLHFMPDVKLLVVGSPKFGAIKNSTFYKTLKTYSKQLGDSVSFTGHIDYGQMPSFYAAADITIVPSIWNEPFGKVIIESMATGVPVIGSRRGGIPEIINHNVNGLLIDNPTDVGQWAHTIVNLLTNTPRRREMGKAARQRVMTTFSNTIRFEHLQAFYSQLNPAKNTLREQISAAYFP